MTSAADADAEYILVVTGPAGTSRHPLESGRRYLLGRGAACDIVIDASFISRQQAELRERGEGWTWHQLGATNPTLRHGRSVQEALLTTDEPLEIQGARGEHVLIELRSARGAIVEPGSGAAEGDTLIVTDPAGARRRYPLEAGGRYIIGRGSGADIAIDSTFVSRQQVELFDAPDGWKLRQLGSANPTLLRGAELSEAPFDPDEPVEIHGAGASACCWSSRPARGWRRRPRSELHARLSTCREASMPLRPRPTSGSMWSRASCGARRGAKGCSPCASRTTIARPERWPSRCSACRLRGSR